MASVGPYIIDGYDKWHNLMPTEPVRGVNGQWVEYADGRLRLQSLTELEDLTNRSGRPLALPPTVHVWQAVIEIDAPAETSLGGCDITLRDVAGDTYSADPAELDDADIEPYYGCLRPLDGPETGPFTVTATFVAPTTLVTGVRVILSTELPRYAWLTPPG